MDLRWSLLALVWSLLCLVASALFVKITRSKDRPVSPNNKNNMDLSKPQVGASSSSSSSHSFTYDVFLNFRGPDTRNNFTGHLYRSLDQAGINTFIDNDLTRGEDITKELLDVIDGSRISIVVFSADYASSKCCLDELVKIIHCKESKQQIVYPIFYKVDSSVIKYQKDQVGKAIAHLCRYKDNLEKMESWKEALKQAASFYGWSISDKSHEPSIIDEIVEVISTKITESIPLTVVKRPVVGIDPRVKDIVKLLKAGQDNPHMVGIWGFGGIGKSTLAKAVFDSIKDEFEHSCFLEIVREDSCSAKGLVKLQKEILSKIIKRNPPNVTNVAGGITLLKQKLSQKGVLLVIDGVDVLAQLKALAECDWFGPKSRIIITTRDKDCLTTHGVDINSIYEVEVLNHQEASELFNLHAFKRNICQEDFSELATEVIRYAKGIPLVLEVLGTHLRSKNKAQWKGALEFYLRYPDKQIQQALQRSYDGLPDRIQEVFLHIACFFKGDKESYVIDVLHSCDLPSFALDVLVGKALIKIEKDNSIWMHDHIEDMGKEIVRQESPNEIGGRSRLWCYEDIRQVLEENNGTNKIRGIVLRTDDERQEIWLNNGSFTNLRSLQIFIVDDGMICGEGVDYLSNQLRVLDWMDCSLRSLPKSFNPKKLGMLRMRGPCTTPLVNERLKNMQYLKSIKLSDCDGLTRIPDLSGLTSLEYLKLSSCEDLVEVDPSVGRLDKLVTLKVSGCFKLQMFLKRINLKSLDTLKLLYCPVKFPEIEEDMKSLNHLELRRNSAIKGIPCSAENLTGLKYLSLEGCDNLTNVPLSIFYGLQCLEELDLQNCSNLVTFPTKSESPPPPFFSTNLTRLRVCLDFCTRLEEISDFPREIDFLSVRACPSLERISKLSKFLVGKDSKMFSELDLPGCWRLCDNLLRYKQPFHLPMKRKEMTSSPVAGTIELMGEAEKLTSLLALFFSCAKSEEFQVAFPPAPLPNWLTCCEEINVINKEHEFKIPQNSNSDKGLAFCIQPCFFLVTFFVYINEIKFDEKFLCGEQVWVHYIPFDKVIRRFSECGMQPPNMYRVMFRFEEHSRLGGLNLGASWGVHLIKNSEGEGQPDQRFGRRRPIIVQRTSG